MAVWAMTGASSSMEPLPIYRRVEADFFPVIPNRRSASSAAAERVRFTLIEFARIFLKNKFLVLRVFRGGHWRVPGMGLLWPDDFKKRLKDSRKQIASRFSKRLKNFSLRKCSTPVAFSFPSFPQAYRIARSSSGWDGMGMSKGPDG